MQKSLVIFGTGTLARLAHYYATVEMGENVTAFVVDRDYRQSSEFLGLPVLEWGQLPKIHSPLTTSIYVAIGYKNIKHREAAYMRVVSLNYELKNIISRASFLAQNICLGTNNFFMPGVVCEPGVKIGSNNVIWSNTTLCHDVEIGDHNFLASNVTIGGETSIGDRNFFGFSSVVLQQKRIGDDCLIAANSLIRENAESNWQYCGIPARKFRKIESSVGVRVE